MKKMKKIVSFLLAMMMVFAMSATAFAADETYSITINNEETGHTYEAYQIFTGDLSTNADGKDVLSNIVWGSGITDAGKAALVQFGKTDGTVWASPAKLAESLNDGNAKAFAIEVAKYLSNTKASTSTVNEDGEYVISGLEAGYYLVKDADGSLADKEDKHDAYTKYILKVVQDVEVAPKTSVPTVEKKVDDKNDSTGNTTGWQDSADYDIGDKVPFKLEATLGEGLEHFDTYKVVFHDNLSAGLTYNNDATYYIDDEEVEDEEAFTSSTSNGLTFTCLDVKALGAESGSKITVVYTATLNTGAVIGSAGNPNTVYLEYSNNPNYEGDGANSPTGNTPTDKVIVFTYKLVVNKTDESGNNLTGATFELYKKNSAGNYVIVGEAQTGADTHVFTWIGLDDGDYKLVEKQAPAGYNIGEDILFTISATHSEEDDEPVLISLTGGDKVTGELTSENKPTGNLLATVKNQKGATLPETGGMGTTLFYVAGLTMMFAAVGAFIARKRMAF